MPHASLLGETWLHISWAVKCWWHLTDRVSMSQWYVYGHAFTAAAIEYWHLLHCAALTSGLQVAA